VDQFFTTTSHHWLLFFTNLGRVYRAKTYELPDASRDAKGQHVANIMAFQPDEQIAQVLALRDYESSPYLVLATKNGLVKKTKLSEYDSPRTGGLIAVNLRDGDELVGAGLTSSTDDLLLVSKKGQSVRFHADDATLRPMGRSTSGVTGMKFRGEDSLLSMSVIDEGTDPDVFVVFESGLAKRSKASQWNVKGRAILGVTVAKQTEKGGDLVGALTVSEDDEVMVVFERGNIVRSRVDEVRLTGRNTAGVWFAKPGKKDSIVGVARNAEKAVEEEVAEADAEGVSPVDGTPVEDAPATEVGDVSDTSSPAGDESDPDAADGVPSLDKSDADGEAQGDGGDE
jgi:DNA gyrase subunit A